MQVSEEHKWSRNWSSYRLWTRSNFWVKLCLVYQSKHFLSTCTFRLNETISEFKREKKNNSQKTFPNGKNVVFFNLEYCIINNVTQNNKIFKDL